MKILELLKDKSKWTQRTMARDKNEEPVFPEYSIKAICWCLSGALRVCYLDPAERDIVRDKLNQVIDIKYGMYMTQFNDNYSYEEVIALVKELNV